MAGNSKLSSFTYEDMLHEVSLAEKSISWIDLFEIYRYTYMMYFMYIHTLSCKVMSSATGLHPGSRVLDKIWMPSADHTPEIMLAIITERIRSIIFALLSKYLHTTTKTENAWWCVHKFWVGTYYPCYYLLSEKCSFR